MKKFLILMLVLGMASAANAVLQISVTPVGGADPEKMMPSDYLLLDIYTDTGLPLGDARDYALIVASTCGTISGGVKHPLAGNFAAITYPQLGTFMNTLKVRRAAVSPRLLTAS